MGNPRPPAGTWGGHDRYQCRWCEFDRLDVPDGVELHEEMNHPDQLLATMLEADKVMTRVASAAAAPIPSAPAPDAPTKG